MLRLLEKRLEPKRVWKEIRSNWKIYLGLAPFMIIFFAFTILPVLKAIFFSFTYFNVLEKPTFIGFDNYLRLFLKDDVFIQSIMNTFVFAIITGPVGYLASLLLAWVINDFSPKLRAILVVVFYAPSISGQLYMIWSLLFSGDSAGYVNSFLLRFGIINQPIQFFTDPQYMLPTVIIVALWMSLGAGFLSLIAGLQGVDRSLLEAGCVDGIRNRFQELWYITLPYIRPQLMFSAIMSITSSFAASDIMMALCGFPSTDYAAHTIVTHLQDYGTIRFDMGYACAIATILFVVMVSINKIVQRLLRGVGK